jgi:DNA invertase Pin-like site-specific DNA recombinase
MKGKPIKLADSVPRGRIFAYIRASTSKQIASPDVQKGLITEYATRLGLTIDGFYVDSATTSKFDLFDRPAGNRLLVDLRPGDVLIVAKLDRLSRSYLEFATTLNTLEKRQITLHVCDMPGGVFDPTNPISMLLIQILVSFANFERTMIKTRTREALQAIKERGEKYCRWAEYGWRWEKHLDPRLKKQVNVKVVDERERAILRKVVELRAAGQSLDQIRQHLSYVMKVRTRMGGEWTTGRITFLFEQGLRLMAEIATGTTNSPLALDNDEEEYDGLIHLEEESND